MPMPTFDFMPDRISPQSLLPGIFGHPKPKKKKKKDSITLEEFQEMAGLLRTSMVDQGATEDEIKMAYRDLESRVVISDTGGRRSTKDTIQQLHKQLQAAGEK